MLVLNSVAVGQEVHEEHAADETYRAEDADRREGLHRIQACTFKSAVGY